MNEAAIENAFREGFEAGVRYHDAIIDRDSEGLDIDTAWQEFKDSCLDL